MDPFDTVFTPPSLAANPDPKPGGHGFDWKQVIDLIVPSLLGAVAMHGSGPYGKGQDVGDFATALMHGYQTSKASQQQTQLAGRKQSLDEFRTLADVDDRRAQNRQRHDELASTFLLNATKDADQFKDDPVAWASYSKMVDAVGAKVFGFDAGTISKQLVFPDKTRGARLQKEAAARIAELSKLYGDKFWEPEVQGATLTFDGRPMKVADLVATSELQLTAPKGDAVTPEASGQTTDRQALRAYARTLGVSVNDLTTDQIRTAREEAGLIQPKTPKSLQKSSVLLDGKAAEVLIDPTPGEGTKVFTLQGKPIENADTRVKPKPDASSLNRGANGLAPGQEFTISEKLAKAWTESTKATKEMTRQFGLMQTGLKRFRAGDKNGGSQAVLVTFQKILDPTSVVRESEYARTATGQSVLNRIEGYTEKLTSGGAGMTDREMAAMVETAKQFLDDMRGYSAGQRKRIQAQVNKYGLDPATVFDDVATGEPSAVPPPPAAAPAGKRFQIISVK